MNLEKGSFWKRWLLHSLAVWTIVNLLTVTAYLFYTYGLGITVQHDSLGARLFSLNVSQATPLLLLSLLLLIELNSLLIRRKFLLFACSSLATGAAGCGILVVSYRMLHDTTLLPSVGEPFWLLWTTC